MKIMSSSVPDTGDAPVQEVLPLHQQPLTFRQAVKALGSTNISYQKLLRAVRAGIIPTYKLHNREYVRICDILMAMGIEGGSHEI